MSAGTASKRRGMPLALLVILACVWVTGRALYWESPFSLAPLQLASNDRAVGNGPPVPSQSRDYAADAWDSEAQLPFSNGSLANASVVGAAFPSWGYGGGFDARSPSQPWRGINAISSSPGMALGHDQLINAAFQMDWHSDGFASSRMGQVFGDGPPGLARMAEQSFDPPPYGVVLPAPLDRQSSDRWSLDVYAFYRSGSGSLSTSQGREPVYGASQAAANLQYRLSPNSSNDPRAYIRAYQALINDGDSEVAAGLSARPIGSVPVRVYSEVRALRGPAGTDIRPAAYAVSEIPPQRLPLDLLLETYAAAGYVAGEAETFFVDGQASLTREVVTLSSDSENPLRFSIGGAGWGGAQEDAQRLDVGPTMRLDLTVGDVPARISVDYRERVAGEAAPESGVAATVSTRF